jgi:hypothetical protein
MDPNAKLIEGENLVKGGEPELLEETKESAKATQDLIKYIAFNKYIFINEKRFVKVYLEFEEDVTPENIKYELTDFSLELMYERTPGTIYRFNVPDLLHKIESDRSTLRTRNKKIILSLRKINEKDNWYAIGKPLSL